MSNITSHRPNQGTRSIAKREWQAKVATNKANSANIMRAMAGAPVRLP